MNFRVRIFVKSAVIKVGAKIHQSLTSVPTPRVRVVHRVSFCLDLVMSEASQFSTFILFTFLLVVKISDGVDDKVSAYIKNVFCLGPIIVYKANCVICLLAPSLMRREMTTTRIWSKYATSVTV